MLLRWQIRRQLIEAFYYTIGLDVEADVRLLISLGDIFVLSSLSPIEASLLSVAVIIGLPELRSALARISRHSMPFLHSRTQCITPSRGT